MSDFPDFPQQDYDPMGDDSPYIDWSGWDEDSVQEDPYERIEQDVMDSLGIASFEEILVLPDDRSLENARGNRFSSLQEAITYLFDAGVLQFSGVVIGAEEVEIEIKPDTDKP